MSWLGLEAARKLPSANEVTIAEINLELVTTPVEGTGGDISKLRSIGGKQYPTLSVPASGGKQSSLEDQRVPTTTQSGNFLLRKLYNLIRPFSPSGGPEGAKALELEECVREEIVDTATHPHRNLIAIINSKKELYIYNYDSGDCLQAKTEFQFQWKVDSISWKPFSRSTLACGTNNGILLWNVASVPIAPGETDPGCNTAFPVLKNVSILKHHGYSVESHIVDLICWSNHGHQLVTNYGGNSLLVWDVPESKGFPVHKFSSSISLLSYSPNDLHLGVALRNGDLYLINTINWTVHRVRKVVKQVMNICWAPDSQLMLFTMKDDPTIYIGRISQKQGSTQIEVKIEELATLDKQEIVVESAETKTKTRVGGPIRCMCIDPHGERLVVSFDSGGCSSLAAVFLIKLTNSLPSVPPLLLAGFIRGRTSDDPLSKCEFATGFKRGSLLAMGYQGNVVRMVPLYYVPESQLQEALEQWEFTL